MYGTRGYETLFWDDVVNKNLDRLKLRVHPVNENQIMELDTVEEWELANKKSGQADEKEG